jgi:hypothetical protein
MAISIDWGTKIISIPQNYLTDLGGGVYELDTNALRLDLIDLEDSEDGMAFPKTHNHNTEVELAGVTYARVIEVINGYTITFEDGQYAVNLVGSNNNIADVTNVNQVSVRSANSAGLIVTTGGSGASAQEIWTYGSRALTDKSDFDLSSLSLSDIEYVVQSAEIENALTLRQAIAVLLAFVAGKATGGGTNLIKFRDQTDTYDRITQTVDGDGNRSATEVDVSDI